MIDRFITVCVRRTYLLLLACLPFAEVSALGVQPMIFTLEPIGAGARTSLQVSNNDDAPVTVEMVARRFEMDENGVESRSDASDELLVFPPVAIVPPNSSQTLQVQYVGDPEIDRSVAYRVSIEQVPVDLGEGARGVGVTANLHTLLNVVPAQARAELSVTDIESNGDQWLVTVKNNGNRFARLSETSWTIRAGSQTRSLSGVRLAERTALNLVLPGATIVTPFLPPEGLSAESASITISTSD